MDWDDLRYFQAVAESGSLAGAARKLAVNHSTVFRRLNALEGSLGVRLFDRIEGRYVLTGAGEEMAQSANRVEEEVSAIERHLASKDFQLSGNLRVTTTEAVAEGYLMDQVVEFHRRYPEIVVDLVVGYQVYDLSKREADIAIRPGIVPPEHLIARRLVRLRWAVYGTAGYARRHGAPRRVEDLVEHRLIGFSDLTVGGLSFDWARRLAGGRGLVFTSNNLLVQRHAARTGIGLALLPVYLGDREKRLKRFFDLSDQMRLDLWLLTHPDLRDTSRVRAFREFIVEAVERDRALLEGTGQALAGNG